MMSKQFTPNSDKAVLSSRLALVLLVNSAARPWARANQGLSLLELIVGSIIALIVIGLAFSGAIANRSLFLEDQSRNIVNQNLRSGLDILGNDIQQIGEGLGTDASFTAVQVTDNGVGTSSELIIRRRPLRALTLCADVTSGSSAPLVVGIPGSTLPGCNPGPDTNNNIWPDQDVELWRNYRLDNPTPTLALIFDGTSVGEVFTYNTEARVPNTPAGSFHIDRTSGTWSNAYLAGRATVYLIEERRYRLCPAAQITQPNCSAVTGQDNILHVIVNGDLNTPIQLINGIDQFNVQVSHLDPSAPSSPPIASQDFCWQGATRVTPVPTPPIACDPLNQAWSQITSVSVTMRGLNDAPSDLIRLDPDTVRAENKRLLTKVFFPRNVLSFPNPTPSPSPSP
jgi:hypothetical protein